MKWENFIVSRTSEFIRIKVNDDFTLRDMYEITNSFQFEKGFAVFTNDKIHTRYRLPKITNEGVFCEWILTSLNTSESGLDSETYRITEIEYLDMYFKATLNNED